MYAVMAVDNNVEKTCTQFDIFYKKWKDNAEAKINKCFLSEDSPHDDHAHRRDKNGGQRRICLNH